MKGKKWAGILLAGAVMFSVAACKEIGGATEGGGQTALGKVSDVYGMGAVTAAELLGSTFSAESVAKLAAVRLLSDFSNGQTAPEDQTGPDTPEQGNENAADPTPGEPEGTEPAPDGTESDPAKDNVAIFHKYFNMLDALLGDGVVQTTVTDNADEDYADYAHKLVIRSVDLEGKPVEHTMYYNETADGEPETDEDGETEAAFTLEGVLRLGDADYTMRGERTESAEDDETEAEISLKAFLDGADSDTYVEVKQETETEGGEVEKEYVYSVYEGGVLIEQTVVAFEKEAKEQKSETSISVGFVSGNASGQYEIEKTVKNNKTEIEVEYVIDGKSGTFEIVLKSEPGKETKYEYRFSDGDAVEMDKDDD